MRYDLMSSSINETDIVKSGDEAVSLAASTIDLDRSLKPRKFK